MARHLGTHDPERANGKKTGRPRGAMPKGQAKEMAGKQTATRAVGRYLDLLVELSEYGRTGTVVRLGALAGFPGATDDPEVVEQAAAAISAKADEATSRVVEIQLRQRAKTLREQAEDLREGTASEIEAAFVEHAAAWGEERGITYEVWREMGVPAAVLKEAGISR